MDKGRWKFTVVRRCALRLLQKIGVVQVVFRCECGRVNRPLIVRDLLDDAPEDGLVLRAYKIRWRRKLSDADRWYQKGGVST